MEESEAKNPKEPVSGKGTNDGGRKPRARVGAKLAALGLSLIVAWLLGEAMVLVVLGEQPKFPRHVVRAPWGLRYNEPHGDYRHKSADMTTYFRINGQGMRDDREFSHAKPPGTKRIVSLGDSFTVGYEVDADKCFSSVLEQELERRGMRVEVLNAGVSGYSNAEELLYLERELIKYSPDLVLLSFYSNDFGDNIRSNLFQLEDGQLEPLNHDYVPAGRLGDFLNTNWLFNFLSERSNAFVFVKEEVTRTLKRTTVEKSKSRVDEAGAGTNKKKGDEPDYEVRLASVILDRLYEFTRSKGIPLVIQSIPDLLPPKAPGIPPEQWELVELFPLDDFDVKRPGLHFASAKKWLDPHRGKRLLYWMRSHQHWTPFSHAVSGKELAALVVREKLLE